MSANTPIKKITFAEAKYLKHAGKIIDIKVSLHIINDIPTICVMDYEFQSFRKVLAFLRWASSSIVDPMDLEEMEVAS